MTSPWPPDASAPCSTATPKPSPPAHPCGLAGINQAGLPKTSTAPDPAGGTALTTALAYNSAGRVASSRVDTDARTYLTYDTRGRVVSSAVPAIGTAPART